MASEELVSKWENYKTAFNAWYDFYENDREKSKQTIDAILQAMVAATKCAFNEKDLEYGKELHDHTLESIDKAINLFTNGTFADLEDYAQENKTTFDYIEWHYQALKAASPYYADSFKLYIERDRRRKDRFYEPRRKTLKKISDAVQRLENDELDVLFIHQPPRTGKSGELTMDVAWHCARDTESSNLYVTYKEGLGGAFIDGVQEIYTDPTYRFADVFPRVKITSTDAKNNKMDLGTDARRKKKYKSLSGKGLESGLNGEYDASGWLIIDDPLEGVQDVMSKEVLKRKQEIFDNNVLSRAKEKCKIILMGTIWDEHDLFSTYKEFLELHKGELRVEEIRIPALDPDTDESNFDYEYGVGFSTEHYRRIRSKHELNDDMVGWLAQYQQSPIPRIGTVFNPEHMNYYTELPEGQPIKVITHIDVASGGEDYLSMPVAYYYEDENGDLVGYIEDVVFDNSEKHITQPQVVAKIKKHHIKQVHVEANAGGEGYADDIQRLLREEKYKDVCNITTDYAPVTKRKQQRIWDNAEDIRKLYFKEATHRDTQYRKFMNNLFSFSLNMRKRAHDDAPDSLSGLVDFEREGSGVSTAEIMSSLF